jgi:hypothetical protein
MFDLANYEHDSVPEQEVKGCFGVILKNKKWVNFI